MINAKIKNDFPSFDFNDLESYLSQYQSRYYGQITFRETNPRLMLGHNGIKYLLWSLQRSKFLYLGFIDSLNLNNPTLVFLSARAHFETTSAIAYLFYNLMKYYHGKVTFEEIDDLLFRLTLGSKCERDRKRNNLIPQAINVLTMIDVMDKLIIENCSTGAEKDYFTTEKPSRGFYEWLAESCHPNFEGISIGSKTEGPDVFFSTTPELKKADLGLCMSAALVSCRSFFTFYDDCFKLLQKKETMPDFIK